LNLAFNSELKTKNSKLKFAGPGRQPGSFLYWSKERNQRKDLRRAGHASAIAFTFFHPCIILNRNVFVATATADRRVERNSLPIPDECFLG
jgi:hypothetical protein